MEALSQAWNFFVNLSQTEHRGLLLSIATIATLLLVKAVLTYPLKAYVYKRALKEANADNFMLTWTFVWIVIIVVFGVISLSGSIQGTWYFRRFSGNDCRLVVTSTCNWGCCMANADPETSF